MIADFQVILNGIMVSAMLSGAQTHTWTMTKNNVQSRNIEPLAKNMDVMKLRVWLLAFSPKYSTFKNTLPPTTIEITQSITKTMEMTCAASLNGISLVIVRIRHWLRCRIFARWDQGRARHSRHLQRVTKKTVLGKLRIGSISRRFNESSR